MSTRSRIWKHCE